MSTTTTERSVPWYRSGATQVSEGVFRIPIQLPLDALRAVNVYALDTSDGVVLIDGGWAVPSALGELNSGLEEIGRSLSDVTDVYVTHIHRDHYTLAVEIRRATGSRIHLGDEERPGLAAIRALGSNVPESSLRELHRSGAPELADLLRTQTAAEPFSAASWEDPDHWITPGTFDLGGRTLDAIHTPGHTKGHYVFADSESGLLFSGDHILPHITPSIGFELGPWGMPLGDYVESLELMRRLPDRRLLPAHGAVTGSSRERAAELLQHHEERFDEIAGELSPNTASTAAGVAAKLPWTRRRRPFGSLDSFNRMIAICETLAHLDVLVERGRAVRDTSHRSDHFFSGVDHIRSIPASTD
ncbi:MAG: MBL fold metallo-hydrolase [Rhodococcus sp. (in: high G+C Gram-positive bacteria)]|uniref:MBL fold metallo-hydrolase n=1 Tax=Rhodococcus sp. TaxID=1831 RepID=UPI003BB0489B